MINERLDNIISVLDEIKELVDKMNGSLDKMNEALQSGNSNAQTKITVVGNKANPNTKGLKSNEDFIL